MPYYYFFLKIDKVKNTAIRKVNVSKEKEELSVLNVLTM